MKIDYYLGNASGNVSAMVVSEVKQEDYKKVNDWLMKENSLIEQVAFIKGFDQPYTMEMAGLEFCLNATRTFGLMLGKQEGLDKVWIQTSGLEQALLVEVDVTNNEAKISIDKPLDMQWLSFKGMSYPIVHMNGISHVLIESETVFDDERIHQLLDVINHPLSLTDMIGQERESSFISTRTNIPAIGLMFVNNSLLSMTPIVYVKETNTLIHEGSCGSGSLAYAYFLNQMTGKSNFDIKQPGGYLKVNVKEDGTYQLSGPIEISGLYSLSIQVNE